MISSPALKPPGAGFADDTYGDLATGSQPEAPERRIRTGNDVREADLLIDVAVPRSLTVVYDATCELCRHARRWLEGQKTYVPLLFAAAAQDPSTRARYGEVPWLGEELVVVADDGRVWVGPAAFITAMWATKRYRNWSYRLSGDTFSGLARQVFHTITAERGRISGLLRHHVCDGAACTIDETISTQTTDTAWSASQPLSPEQRKWLAAAGLLQ